jgi:hypothetical protein
MECPKCHVMNPDGKKFCRECGAKLTFLCPQCAAELSPGDKFCGECVQFLQLPSTPTPKGLSIDEKISEIQRYLPQGKGSRGRRNWSRFCYAIWRNSRPYRRDLGRRRCTASWTPEVNGLQLINGFRTVMPGKRLKSLSAVHSSRTPWKRQSAATRASWTCGPVIRPSSRALRSSGQ